MGGDPAEEEVSLVTFGGRGLKFPRSVGLSGTIDHHDGNLRPQDDSAPRVVTVRDR
jgi:hypothetical protein